MGGPLNASAPKYHARHDVVSCLCMLRVVAVLQRRSLYMERSREEEGGDSGAVVARYSLDVSAGCGGRQSALLDEYERLAFEAQLNRAILRRCYSEPSPARFPRAVQPAGARTPRGGEGDAPMDWRFCRLHEAVPRWLEAVKPVLCWLRSAWERRWMERAAAAAPRDPPTMPRVQLMDFLC